MRKDTPFVLVGNALSVMVAATKLAKNGADVVIINGSNNWGGHFTTVPYGDVSYDAGMVLHEFTSYNSENSKEDLRTYDPTIRNDAGRFCKTVRQYVNLYQETHEITAPKMYVEGKCYDDMLIANSLSSLQHLPFADAIRKDLLTLLDSPSIPALHASNKLISDEFKKLSYQAASLANHGQTFHARLIEPFCKKLLNVGTDDVVSLYHRVPWLPLFYPETLLSYFQGSPQKLPPTVFSYPTGECVGDLANKLKAEIQRDSHIRIINEHSSRLKFRDDGKYEIEFTKHERIIANKMAWSSSSSDLLRVLGREESARNYEKCSFALVFLRIPTDLLKLDFTVLSIVDPDIMTYRITNQSRCSALDSWADRIVIEINTDYLAEKNALGVKKDLKVLVIEELVALGIVEDGACVELVKIIELRKVLPLPNSNNMKSFTDEMSAVLDATPLMSLLGSTSGFSSSSFNHQVLQGLKLYDTWGKC
jgi:hypothetical protein